jgi:hypothetical protein
MKTSRPPGVRSGTRQRSESSGFPSVPTASVSSFDRPQWVTKEAPADGRQGTEHGWEAGRKRKRAKCAGVSCMGLGRCGRGWMHQPTHACCRVSQGVGGQEACATVRTASLERIRPSDQTGRNAGSQPASQPASPLQGKSCACTKKKQALPLFLTASVSIAQIEKTSTGSGFQDHNTVRRAASRNGETSACVYCVLCRGVTYRDVFGGPVCEVQYPVLANAKT